MTSKDQAKNEASEQAQDKNYEVGYGRPPRQTQFRKGQSGNPNGRPKGSKNLKTIVEEVFNSRIQVRQGGKVRTMTKMEAIVEKMFEGALKGDSKARAETIRLVGAYLEQTSAAVGNTIGKTGEEIVKAFLEEHIAETPGDEKFTQPEETGAEDKPGDEK
jgi:hypothetical protein